MIDTKKDIYRAVDVLLKHAADETSHTVASWLYQWLTVFKKPRIKQGTYRDYVLLIDQRIRPKLGHIPLGDLDGIALQCFLNDINLPNTRLKCAQILKASLTKATKMRLIPYNPFDVVELPRYVKTHYKPLSFEMQQKVYDNCIDKYRPMFYFLCCTGLRIGEFLALDWSKDVHKTERYVDVYKTVDIDTGEIRHTTKTEYSTRHVPILPDLFPVIEQLKNYKYTYNGCRNYFRRLYGKLRLYGYNLHTFRHTFVSVCNSVGMRAKTAQSIVGHSDVQLTLNIYTHVFKPGESNIGNYVARLRKAVE